MKKAIVMENDTNLDIGVLQSTMIGALGSADLNYTLPYNMGTSSSSYTYGNVTISNGSSGSFLTSGLNGTSWANSGGLHVTSDAEFEGDIKWKGRSLGKLLEKIEDRLAILAEPDPAKLEKYAALKKAYDQYKLMEKLIGED